MRFIVNSKYIELAFKHAITNNCARVELTGLDELIFLGGEQQHVFHVHTLEHTAPVDLDKISLWRAYKFIAAIEEQPIVVEISYDQIEVSQFVKRFINNKP
jgi:hypothetical protein